MQKVKSSEKACIQANRLTKQYRKTKINLRTTKKNEKVFENSAERTRKLLEYFELEKCFGKILQRMILSNRLRLPK